MGKVLQAQVMERKYEKVQLYMPVRLLFLFRKPELMKAILLSG